MTKESNQQETFRIELEREIEEVNDHRQDLQYGIVEKVQELITKKWRGQKLKEDIEALDNSLIETWDQIFNLENELKKMESITPADIQQDIEKEHEANESLKGHRIVVTCNHVQNLGAKVTKWNVSDDQCCAECVLTVSNHIMEAERKGIPLEEMVKKTYANGTNPMFAICLDCLGKPQDNSDLK